MAYMHCRLGQSALLAQYMVALKQPITKLYVLAHPVDGARKEDGAQKLRHRRHVDHPAHRMTQARQPSPTSMQQSASYPLGKARLQVTFWVISLALSCSMLNGWDTLVGEALSKSIQRQQRQGTQFSRHRHACCLPRLPTWLVHWP
jgi:hypothetical protein